MVVSRLPAGLTRIGAQMRDQQTGGNMTAGPPDRRMVPTQLAALAAGVSEATIRKWSSRGKLRRYGRPGRAEYDIGELMELALARNARERRRPG